MSLRLRSRSQLEQLREEEFRRIELRPAVPQRPQTPRLAPWLTQEGVVGQRWATAICVSWFAVYAMAILLEPDAADPSAPEPLWAILLFTTLLGILTVTCFGLARRQRLGLVASVGAAGLALGAAVMCPVSGHHATAGSWWYLQMAGFTYLIGLSLFGLTRSRSKTS